MITDKCEQRESHKGREVPRAQRTGSSSHHLSSFPAPSMSLSTRTRVTHHKRALSVSISQVLKSGGVLMTDSHPVL